MEDLYRQAASRGKRLVLSGHSLGGCVALLCTLRLLRALEMSKEAPAAPGLQPLCVTLAAVPVGNHSLSQWVQERGYQQALLNYVLAEDPVPELYSSLLVSRGDDVVKPQPVQEGAQGPLPAAFARLRDLAGRGRPVASEEVPVPSEAASSLGSMDGAETVDREGEHEAAELVLESMARQGREAAAAGAPGEAGSGQQAPPLLLARRLLGAVPWALGSAAGLAGSLVRGWRGFLPNYSPLGTTLVISEDCEIELLDRVSGRDLSRAPRLAPVLSAPPELLPGGVPASPPPQVSADAPSGWRESIRARRIHHSMRFYQHRFRLVLEKALGHGPIPLPGPLTQVRHEPAMALDFAVRARVAFAGHSAAFVRLPSANPLHQLGRRVDRALSLSQRQQQSPRFAGENAWLTLTLEGQGLEHVTSLGAVLEPTGPNCAIRLLPPPDAASGSVLPLDLWAHDQHLGRTGLARFLQQGASVSARLRVPRAWLEERARRQLAEYTGTPVEYGPAPELVLAVRSDIQERSLLCPVNLPRLVVVGEVDADADAGELFADLCWLSGSGRPPAGSGPLEGALTSQLTLLLRARGQEAAISLRRGWSQVARDRRPRATHTYFSPSLVARAMGLLRSTRELVGHLADRSLRPTPAPASTEVGEGRQEGHHLLQLAGDQPHAAASLALLSRHPPEGLVVVLRGLSTEGPSDPQLAALVQVAAGELGIPVALVAIEAGGGALLEDPSSPLRPRQVGEALARRLGLREQDLPQDLQGFFIRNTSQQVVPAGEQSRKANGRSSFAINRCTGLFQ